MSEETPDKAVAVSPTDQTSDREQSDADQVASIRASDRNRELIMEGLAELSSRAEDTVEASRALTDATLVNRERESTARNRYRKTMITICAASAVILLTVLVLLSLVLANQRSGVAVRDQIADCVQPTGQCFKDGQKRTGDVLTAVNKVIILAAACAPDYVGLPILERQSAIQACIVRGLK